MMLVVSVGFITARSVKNPFLRIESPRQWYRPLIMKPCLQAFGSFLMVTSPVQVEHHHARFVPVIAVIERAHARKTPVALRLNFAIDKQVAGNSAIELVQNRLWRDQVSALIQNLA